jgi:hypothetical protein
MATLSEKALAVIFWQPRQWQAMVSKGGAVTSKVTRPQRQLPFAFMGGPSVSAE